MPERLRHVGSAAACEAPGDVPGALMRRAFELAGRDRSDFQVYRVSMRYPPVPSSIVVRFKR